MSLYLIGLEIQMAKQVGDWQQVELLTARYYRIKETRDRAAALAKLPIDDRAGKAAV